MLQLALKNHINPKQIPCSTVGNDQATQELVRCRQIIATSSHSLFCSYMAANHISLAKLISLTPPLC